MNSNIRAVEAALTALQAPIDGLRLDIKVFGVVLCIVGLTIAAEPIIIKFIR